jgi:hypothetical protein
VMTRSMLPGSSSSADFERRPEISMSISAMTSVAQALRATAPNRRPHGRQGALAPALRPSGCGRNSQHRAKG